MGFSISIRNSTHCGHQQRLTSIDWCVPNNSHAYFVPFSSRLLHSFPSLKIFLFTSQTAQTIHHRWRIELCASDVKFCSVWHLESARRRDEWIETCVICIKIFTIYAPSSSRRYNEAGKSCSGCRFWFMNVIPTDIECFIYRSDAWLDKPSAYDSMKYRISIKLHCCNPIPFQNIQSTNKNCIWGLSFDFQWERTERIQKSERFRK